MGNFLLSVAGGTGRNVEKSHMPSSQLPHAEEARTVESKMSSCPPARQCEIYIGSIGSVSVLVGPAPFFPARRRLSGVL
jgi:hypothetical protein